MSNFMYQAFSEVAKQKAFVTAAKVLNVTPSAISHSINGLEKELGFALFFRNRNGVQLTSAGEKILPIVRELLNTEDKKPLRSTGWIRDDCGSGLLVVSVSIGFLI